MCIKKININCKTFSEKFFKLYLPLDNRDLSEFIFFFFRKTEDVNIVPTQYMMYILYYSDIMRHYRQYIKYTSYTYILLLTYMKFESDAIQNNDLQV